MPFHKWHCWLTGNNSPKILQHWLVRFSSLWEVRLHLTCVCVRDKEINKKSEDDEIDDECCSKAHFKTCIYLAFMITAALHLYCMCACLAFFLDNTSFWLSHCLFPKESGTALRFTLFKCMHIIDLIYLCLNISWLRAKSLDLLCVIVIKRTQRQLFAVN